MRLSPKYFLPFIFAVLLCSCAKDDTILYSDSVMAGVTDGLLLTDSGLTYHITEYGCEEIPDTTKRVFALCDILRVRQGEDDAYDVRLRDFARVLQKDPVMSGSVDTETLGEDPVELVQAWTSGPYINTRLALTVVQNSSVKHRINLLLDEERSSADTLFFELRHDASGEYYGASGIDSSKLKTAGSYASFPVKQLIPEGKESVVMQISWRWHVANADGALMKDTVESKMTGILRR